MIDQVLVAEMLDKKHDRPGASASMTKTQPPSLGAETGPATESDYAGGCFGFCLPSVGGILRKSDFL